MRKTQIVLFFLWMVGAAHAAQRPVPSDSSRVYDLDEVIVVSQTKDTYRLRQQPLASTVLGREGLLGHGLHDVRAVSAFVPSLLMPAYGSRLTSAVYVRGIGSRVNSPSMGFYVDDIPLMNKAAFNTHLYQTERIDVLRGPQGTLYGMNAEGGLVRIFSKSPLDAQGTELKLGLGTAGHRQAEVVHSRKLGDKMAVSLAAFYQGADGFFKNTATGQAADGMDEAGGRFRLTARPADRWKVDWTSDYQYVRQDANPYGVFYPDQGRVDAPGQDAPSRYRRNLLTNGLHVTHTGVGFTLQSTTSWQFLHDRLLMDVDYSPLDFFTVNQGQQSQVITQDFTVKSQNKSRWHWTNGLFLSHEWLKTTALNAFGDAFSQQMGDRIGTTIYNQILQSLADRMGETAAAAMIQRLGGVNVSMDLSVPGTFRTPQTNIGLFHESNIELTEQLTATLGLRYDYSRNSIRYDAVGVSTLGFNIMGSAANVRLNAPLTGNEHVSFQQLLPKVGLLYRWHNGSNLYATVTKGYRSGGFNIQLFSDIIQADVQSNLRSVMQQAMEERCDIEKTVNHTATEYAAMLEGIRFKPEESWNYEVGTHLNLFNHTVQADLSAYYMQIRNQQLSVFTSDYGYGRKMVNAGRSYSCGLEMAVRGSAVSDRLTWAATYAYTHAVFKDYTSSDNSSGAVVDYRGKRVPFVPEHAFSLLADYRVDLHDGKGGALVFGTDLSGLGRIWWNEENTCQQRVYVVLGAHVKLQQRRYSINLWARNLTDTHYNTFAFQSKATGEAVYYAQRGNPFQLGVEIDWRF